MPTLTPTTNNSFRVPTAANNGSDFAIGVQDLASDIDAMWGKGTLASRPATPATTGVAYFATDTGLTYMWNGTAWQTVLLAGAWSALTINSPVTAMPGSVTPSARLEGDVVRLKGALNVATSLSLGALIATVPAGLRPSSPVLWSGPYVGAVSIQIASNGNMTVITAVSGSGCGFALDGITYSLN